MLGQGGSVGSSPVGASNYIIYLSTTSSTNARSAANFKIALALVTGTDIATTSFAAMVPKTSLHIATRASQQVATRLAGSVHLAAEISTTTRALEAGVFRLAISGATAAFTRAAVKMFTLSLMYTQAPASIRSKAQPIVAVSMGVVSVFKTSATPNMTGKVPLAAKTLSSNLTYDAMQPRLLFVARTFASTRTKLGLQNSVLLGAISAIAARTIANTRFSVKLAGRSSAQLIGGFSVSLAKLLQGSARASTRAKASTVTIANIGASPNVAVNSKTRATATTSLKAAIPSKVRSTSAPMLRLSLQSASRLASRTVLRGNAYVHLPARVQANAKARTTFAPLHLNLGVKARSAIRTLLAHFRGPRLPLAAVTVATTPPIMLTLSSTLPVLTITPHTYVTLTTNEPVPVVLSLV